MKSNYMENQFKSTIERKAEEVNAHPENVESSRNSSLVDFTRKKSPLLAQAFDSYQLSGKK